MFGKGLQLKTAAQLVLFLSQVKSLKNFVNNRLVDDVEKRSLFSDPQYSFRSSRSTVDLLTVVSDRNTTAFDRSGATQAVALDISKGFDRVWHASLFHRLETLEFEARYLALFCLSSVIDCF